ncbi:phosphoribosylanthranilate isomerase [Phycisphaera mikurensis]|uniref:N-(5'-phosphoribosyl)anthranilate isomerase n=1 Tax=Phycisphaera mikurensis (strain NBRC 102666 / KCTC 22515 / FYK2301M01) TaxID=1142394 RepID=I0IF02_PHYMF|nr:phosphoribosylanthranilate isomerase [Phycisphaera mikurensis]MBB6441634.1 phosphoribosylanthranilate isomerase [Phycisphaera mikurensis]BAM03840.1 N-(5'-phosphoribosyl)anthranilate isomerase [Phycisphaera mikurensis NBRC 102666]
MTVRGFHAPAETPADRTRVKICGVRDVGTAAVCAEAGVDFVGLVFVRRSPRCVETAEAEGVTRALHAFGLHAPVPVGLFCDHAVEDVRAIAAAAGLTTVQLHGRESAAEVAALADAGLTVWKAVPFDADGVRRWAGVRGLAALLVDAPPPARGGVTGGHGVRFDWQALAGVDRGGLPPLWLAGGLTPENVAGAIGIVRPFGVDVSSGVESAKGVKDAAKVRAFVGAAGSVAG